MSNSAGIILAAGISITAIIVAIAVANHIEQAQTVEFRTPYYAIRSSQR